MIPNQWREMAVEIIKEKVDEFLVSPTATLDDMRDLLTVYNAAQYRASTTPATGLLLEYEDETAEVFLGVSTDPYTRDDFRFYETNSHRSITLVGSKKNDCVTLIGPDHMGGRSAESYQEELDELLMNAYPVFTENGDKFVGDKLVRFVTVV